MNIVKSSRHAKIAGDFGESLVLYWLSKSGFECARVDHTGIDLIANDPSSHELMGISVKTRTRVIRTEATSINLDSKRPRQPALHSTAYPITPSSWTLSA